MMSDLDQFLNSEFEYVENPNHFTLNAAFNNIVNEAPLLQVLPLRLPPPTIGSCVICGDNATGRHYGAISCEGCKGFFKRTIRKTLTPKCLLNGNCEITKATRNRCQFCRLRKCVEMGMTAASVQQERKPLGKLSTPPTNFNLKRTYSSGSGSLQLSPHESNFKSRKLNLSLPVSEFHLQLAIVDKILNQNPNKSRRGRPTKMLALNGQEGGAGPYNIEGQGGVGGGYGSDLSNSSSGFIEVTEENDVKVEGEEEGASQNVIAVVGGDDTDALGGPSAERIDGLSKDVCDYASQLLFNSVHWAQRTPAFQTLTFAMQVGILKSCWNELFVLGLIEEPGQELFSLLAASGTPTENLENIQAFVNTLVGLNIGEVELEALKLLVLFSPDRVRAFKESAVAAVTEFQNMVSKELSYHVQVEMQGNVNGAFKRFSDLTLLLPQLRTFTAPIIEEVFFSHILGLGPETPIHSVIHYIMDMVKTPPLDKDHSIQDNA